LPNISIVCRSAPAAPSFSATFANAERKFVAAHQEARFFEPAPGVGGSEAGV
jgi:hypothetical protein